MPFIQIMEARTRPFDEISEPPSYELAMRNSELPETAAIAERIAAVCEEPMRFDDLDVVEVRWDDR